MSQWLYEPNSLSLMHSNVKCLINRHHMGFLRGYVFLPEGHKFHGVDYDDLYRIFGKELGVELSFSDYIDGTWAVGFAFMSVSDFIPYDLENHELSDVIKFLREKTGINPTKEDYKNFAYAEEKVKLLAEILSRPLNQ